MDVRVDGEFVRAEREKRAWSQEHLAGAAGIGVRTVQRIEASGVASYESARAIAAALDKSIAELRREVSPPTLAPVGTDSPADTLPPARPPLRVGAAVGWLGVGVTVLVLAGAGGFWLLHDYQKVRVLRTLEHWTTAAD